MIRARLIHGDGRQLTTDDAILIGSLDQACFPEDDYLSAADFESGWWWVLSEAGSPLAYCGMQALDYDPTRVSFTRAGVVERARGQGLQRRMLALRLRHARRVGVFLRALTYTTPDNVASNNNLIAAGFRLYKPAAPDSFLYWFREIQ